MFLERHGVITTMLYRVSVIVFASLAPPLFALAQSGPAVDGLALFAQEVFPVLEENCLRCHGRDGKTKGGLALTTPAGLREGGNQGPAIDPEDPGASLLLEMVSYKDEDHEMPPDGKLSAGSIEAIAQWVKLGAPWPANAAAQADTAGPLPLGMDFDDEGLWAFLPLGSPAAPEADAPEWAESPIDAFVYARLAAAGIAPAPAATKSTLIRRLYYDFTGLPPTPEEVEAFVNDERPGAYEHLVDYLLASPHYGEKWGRHWLDLVHYADSNGYERDTDKPYMWRYRDYVIRSFNEDKPYDEFVIEQLAGDELERPGAGALIATGYYRLGLWDDEPADALQGLYDNLDDMVDTTGKVFLGITMGCARCHDHKIDPILQSEYYEFLSFFHGVKMIQRIKGNGILRSILPPEEEAAYQRKLREKEARENSLAEEIRAYLASFKSAVLRERPGLIQDSGIVLSDISGLEFRFYRDTWESLPDFEMLKPETAGRVEDNFITTELATRDAGVGFVFEGKLRVPKAGEYRFFIESVDGVRLLLDGNVLYSVLGLGQREDSVVRDLEGGAYPFRVEYFTKNGPPKLELSWSSKFMEKRPLSAGAQQSKNNTALRPLFRKHAREILGPEAVAGLKRAEKELKAVKNREVPGKMAATVSEKGAAPPATHILIRGNPHAKGKEVAPGFPALFRAPRPAAPSPYQTAQSSGRRRQLAEWIASPDNPLTARVMANRIWQYHFGRGIVRSSNNFGVMGERPTHPELLDWMAGEFIRGGWRMKPLHKMIAMSRTYRMSSQGRAEALARDPDNDLFWRFNMRRLTSEEVRDSLLKAGGTLNTEMFGPGVYPELPAEVIATSSKQSTLLSSGMWGESTPEEAARRSIYIHVKRSLLLPLLTDFDMAETDASCPVRFSTTLPTQALGMLNSDFINGQAKLFAARLPAEAGGGVQAQVRRALEIATSRAATPEELARGLAFINEMRTVEGLPLETALERFCLLALNLNEFVFLD